MNNLPIVIGREYFTRVKKTSFIVLTILMPFLMVALVTVPIMLGMIKDDEVKEVVVLDQTGKYIQLFLAEKDSVAKNGEGYLFVPADRPLSEYQKMSDGGPVAVVAITDDLASNPSAVKICSQSEVQHELQSKVEDILVTQIRKDKLAAYDIPQLDSIIDDIQQSFSVQTVKWNDNGEETFSSGAVAMMLGLISALLIYMFVLCYGAMVMQGVMEEKTSRIVEVIIGSVKPFQLMMGKIIGIMFVGFTQILIWGVMVASLLGILTLVLSPEASEAVMAASNPIDPQTAQMVEESPMADLLTAVQNLPLAEIAILFVLYFLGGYILYSSFYAAIGAAINSQEDSSQFMMPMMIVMIFSMYAAMGSMENTDGPLAFWASIFPLTSPIVMMVRLPFGVPLWQELLSLALLFATAVLFVWASARIYRVGILMYGKKPTIKEMLKWMRYS